MSNNVSDIVVCSGHGTPNIINGTAAVTCHCDAFWKSSDCSELTMESLFTFHYIFIAVWFIIGVAASYYTYHVARVVMAMRRHRALHNSPTSMQLGACICCICCCISGIIFSVTFMTDTFPELEHTDLTIPALFMITASILTFRRIILSSARFDPATRVFVARADIGAIVFTIILALLSIVDRIVIGAVSLYWNGIGALYGLCILPSIIRATHLLSSLLPTTKSQVSRHLIERNVRVLRIAFVQALTLVVLIGTISVVGRDETTIVPWNALYILETILIMGLTIEVIVIMGHIHEHTKVLNPGAVTTFVVNAPSPLAPTKSFHSLRHGSHGHHSTSGPGAHRGAIQRGYSVQNLPSPQPPTQLSSPGGGGAVSPLQSPLQRYVSSNNYRSSGVPSSDQPLSPPGSVTTD